VKARGGTPGPSVPNDPRPEWAHEPSAMTVADLRGVVVPVRPVGEGAMACVPGFRFTPPGAFAVRPVAAPNRLLPTTSVPPMIRSESRGTRPGGPPDDSPARERWVPSPKNIQPRQGRQNPGVVVESSIARACHTARLFRTETGAGTDCWPSPRDILGGGWARWSRGNRESATPQRRKASVGSGSGHRTAPKCRPSLRLSWINCQMDRSDPIAPSPRRASTETSARGDPIDGAVRAGRSKWNSWSTGPEGRPGQFEDGYARLPLTPDGHRCPFPYPIAPPRSGPFDSQRFWA
jgi:hypothetical protein